MEASELLSSCAGPAREGIVTYTKLDASQGPWSMRMSMQSIPDSGPSGSQPGGLAPHQAAAASQHSASLHSPQNFAGIAMQQGEAQRCSQPAEEVLKQAPPSSGNACSQQGQSSRPELPEPSPWKTKRRKENSAPASAAKRAKHAERPRHAGAGTPPGSSEPARSAQLDGTPSGGLQGFEREEAAAHRPIQAALWAAGFGSCPSPGAVRGPLLDTEAPSSEPAPNSKAVGTKKSSASIGLQTSGAAAQGTSPSPEARRSWQSHGSAKPDRKQEAQPSAHNSDAAALQVDAVGEEQALLEQLQQQQAGPQNEEEDMDIDIIGGPVDTAIAELAAGREAPEHAPSQARPASKGIAEAPALEKDSAATAGACEQYHVCALPAPVVVPAQAAAVQAMQAAGRLCEQLCAGGSQKQIAQLARDALLIARQPAALPAPQVAKPAPAAGQDSDGEAMPLPTAPCESTPAQHALPATAAELAVTGGLLPMEGILPCDDLGPALPEPRGSLGPQSLPQGTLMCTEVEALPSTLVEARVQGTPASQRPAVAFGAAAPAAPAPAQPWRAHGPPDTSPGASRFQHMVPDSAEADCAVHVTLVPSGQLGGAGKLAATLPQPTALEVQVRSSFTYALVILKKYCCGVRFRSLAQGPYRHVRECR